MFIVCRHQRVEMALGLIVCLGGTGCTPSDLGLAYSKVALGSSLAAVEAQLGKGNEAAASESHPAEGIKPDRYLKWTGEHDCTVIVGFDGDKVVYKEVRRGGGAGWGSYQALNASGQEIKGAIIPKEIAGPQIKIETALKPGMKPSEVEALLGPPTSKRTTDNYTPPFMNYHYDPWGLQVQFHGTNGLCQIFVTKRWDKPIHGLRIGDKLLDAHTAQPLVADDGNPPPPKSRAFETFRLAKHSRSYTAPKGSETAKSGRTHPYSSGWQVRTSFVDPWHINQIHFLDSAKFGDWRSPGLFGL